MKKTIKLALVAILVTVGAATANAQLGVQAGYVNSTMKAENKTISDLIYGSGNFNGFEVGLTYNMPIQGGFALQYGLLYTNLFKNSEILTVETKRSASYLNIPFRIAYGLDLGGAKVFAYGGPNFAIGLTGKNKVGNADLNWYKEVDGDESDPVKRFDILLGAGLGVQFSNFIVKGGYDWGLLNPYGTDNYKINRNQFNISLGYQF